MEALGQSLHRIAVAEPPQASHPLQAGGNTPGERSTHILAHHLIGRQHRLGGGCDEFAPGLWTELAIGRKSVCRLKRGDGLGEVLGKATVDQARREAGAIQKDLRLQQHRIDTLRFADSELGLIDGGRIELGRAGHAACKGKRGGKDEEEPDHRCPPRTAAGARFYDAAWPCAVPSPHRNSALKRLAEEPYRGNQYSPVAKARADSILARRPSDWMTVRTACIHFDAEIRSELRFRHHAFRNRVPIRGRRHGPPRKP